MEWLKLNEDGEVELVSEEVGLVPELATIQSLKYNKGPGDADGRKRTRAKQELKYMYLVHSAKSPYKDYTEKEKIEEAKKDCKFPNDWEESVELKFLIKKYTNSRPSKLERMLKGAEKFLDKYQDYLNTIDFETRGKNGELLHDPSKIIATLQKLPALAQTLQDLEQQVKLGIVGTPKSKGDHELGWMAMNENLIELKQREDDSSEDN